MAKMTFLKKEPNTQEKTLKYWLHQHYAGVDEPRLPKTVHASELTKPEGFCPRFYALYDKTKEKPRGRYLSTSEKLTFQMGRDQERNVVNAFADMNKAICHWRCVACGQLHEFQSRPFKCDSCGVRRFDPVEVRFESALNGASCGVDMLVAMGEPKLRPVELKTIAADKFKELQAPLAEHRLRTTLYLRILAECNHNWSNMVSCEKATILYVAKNAFGAMDASLAAHGIKEKFSPFKEFTVTRNDALVEGICRRATVVKEWREGKRGMPAGICSTAFSKRAQGCDYKTSCFSGDFPVQSVWEGCA